MSTTSVFATASSSIHADLIVVALKRIGVATNGISVLYPSESRPDCVLYWIDGATQLLLSPVGDRVTVSGPLRFALDQHQERAAFPSLVGGLRSLGLSEEQSASFEAALLENRVVVCIEAADESALALIFHILHHIGADKIVLTETVPAPLTVQRSHSPVGRRREKTDLILSAA